MNDFYLGRESPVGAVDRLAPLFAATNYILEMPTSRLPARPPWEV